MITNSKKDKTLYINQSRQCYETRITKLSNASELIKMNIYAHFLNLFIYTVVYISHILARSSTCIDPGPLILSGILDGHDMRRSVVLIANSGHLENASNDAELVAEAVVRSGLCGEENPPVKLFDKTGAEIKKALEDVVSKLSVTGNLFVWYSGHAYGMLHKGEGWTLIVPEADVQGSDEDSVEVVEGLWLEETLFDIVERRKGLTSWCVIAACRPEIEHRGNLDVGLQVPKLTDRLPKPGQNQYAFMYACQVGKSMWDTSIFAKSFCYNLHTQPKNLKGLEDTLKLECPCVTFGDISLTLRCFGQSDGIILHRRTGSGDTEEFNCKPMWIDAIRDAPLVAYFLHELAADEIFRSDEGSVPEGSDDPQSNDNDNYVAVRSLAAEIVENFFPQKDNFQELRSQLSILECSSLLDVKERLSSFKAQGSAGYPAMQWRPDEPNLGWEDMRVVRNLPHEVICALGQAIKRWKENCKDLPVEPMMRLLRIMGCHFTEKKYPDLAGNFSQKPMNEYMQYYFCIQGVLLLKAMSFEAFLGCGHDRKSQDTRLRTFRRRHPHHPRKTLFMGV